MLLELHLIITVVNDILRTVIVERGGITAFVSLLEPLAPLPVRRIGIAIGTAILGRTGKSLPHLIDLAAIRDLSFQFRIIIMIFVVY